MCVRCFFVCAESDFSDGDCDCCCCCLWWCFAYRFGAYSYSPIASIATESIYIQDMRKVTELYAFWKSTILLSCCVRRWSKRVSLCNAHAKSIEELLTCVWCLFVVYNGRRSSVREKHEKCARHIWMRLLHEIVARSCAGFFLSSHLRSFVFAVCHCFVFRSN